MWEEDCQCILHMILNEIASPSAISTRLPRDYPAASMFQPKHLNSRNHFQRILSPLTLGDIQDSACSNKINHFYKYHFWDFIFGIILRYLNTYIYIFFFLGILSENDRIFSKIGPAEINHFYKLMAFVHFPYLCAGNIAPLILWSACQFVNNLPSRNIFVMRHGDSLNKGIVILVIGFEQQHRFKKYDDFKLILFEFCMYCWGILMYESF